MYNDDIKRQIKEILYDNTRIGSYDDQEFIIFDGWYTIRDINKLMGYSDEYDYRQGDNTLNLDQILFWVNSNIPFPLDLDDLKYIQDKRYILELLDQGQLSFIDGIKPDISIYDPIIDIILEYLDLDDPDTDSLNWNIKNNLIESVEWGFDDEYRICDNCQDQVLRTSPDSYGWTPDYYTDSDGYIYCKACCDDLDLLRESIINTQDQIDNNNQPSSLPHIFDLDDTWIKIVDPDDKYYHHWQNGLHHGMNDDPLRQGKLVRSIRIDNKPIFQVIFRIYPSQFYVEWDTYLRVDPNLEINLNPDDLDQIVKDLGSRFNSPDGRFPYDIASLYEKALKNIDVNFASISVDPNDGSIDIKGSNNINEYLGGLNQ